MSVAKMSGISAVVFAAVTMGGVAKAGTFVWVGEEGSWSDTTKWHQEDPSGATGVLPGVDDAVRLSGTKAKINIDGNYRVKDVCPYVRAKDAGTALEYVFVGDGKLTVGSDSADTSFDTYDCNFVIDGPDFYCQEGTQYIQGGSLTLKKGVFTVKNLLHQHANGRLIIDGGTVTSAGDSDRLIYLRNGWKSFGDPIATLELRSGVLEARTEFQVGYFTVTGGTWDRSKTSQTHTLAGILGIEDMRVDIQRGDTLVLHSGDTTIADEVYKFRNVIGTAVSQYLGAADINKKFPEGMDVGVYRIPQLAMTMTGNQVINGEVLDLYKFNVATGVHEAVVNVSTVKVNQAGGVNLTPTGADMNKVGMAPLHIHSYKPITFESASANDLKIFSSGGSQDSYWYFHKGLTCNTSSDAGIGYTQYIYCPIFGEGSFLDVEGKGTAQIGFSTRNEEPKHGLSLSNRLGRVSVTGGSSLTLQNFSWNNYHYPFRADHFRLGADSSFETLFSNYSQTEFDSVDLDPSGTLILRVLPSTDVNYAASKFPAMLNFGPQYVNKFQTDATRPKLELRLQNATAGEKPEDHWQCAWINGTPTVWSKDNDPYLTVTGCSTAPNWRGTVDGSWSNGKNWSTGSAPSGKTNVAGAKAVFGGGYVNTRVTVDNTVEVFQVRVSENTAPLAFVGNGAVKIVSTAKVYTSAASAYNCDAAIASSSSNPVIFDVPVTHTGTDNEKHCTVNSSGRGYIAFNKATSLDRPIIIGDVRVAGTLTAFDLLFGENAAGRPNQQTRLSVLPGGTVNVTFPSKVGAYSDVSIIVHSNATVNISKVNEYSVWGHNANRLPIWVKKHGVFNCRAPLGGGNGCTKVAFRGEGVVMLADTGYADPMAATTKHVVEIDGNTFAIDAFTPGCPLVLKGSPTWGAAVDWTYDLDPITLPAGETLTIDTDDINGNGVHTVTLASKVTADKLVVKGAGTLKLATAQTFGVVTFAEGTSLAVDDGIVEPGKWTTILTLSKGTSVDVGNLTVADKKIKIRQVKTDAATLLQAKVKAGQMIILR